jgi:hypothetical protein
MSYYRFYADGTDCAAIRKATDYAAKLPSYLRGEAYLNGNLAESETERRGWHDKSL